MSQVLSEGQVEGSRGGDSVMTAYFSSISHKQMERGARQRQRVMLQSDHRMALWETQLMRGRADETTTRLISMGVPACVCVCVPCRIHKFK